MRVPAACFVCCGHTVSLTPLGYSLALGHPCPSCEGLISVGISVDAAAAAAESNALEQEPESDGPFVPLTGASRWQLESPFVYRPLLYTGPFCIQAPFVCSLSLFCVSVDPLRRLTGSVGRRGGRRRNNIRHTPLLIYIAPVQR